MCACVCEHVSVCARVRECVCEKESLRERGRERKSECVCVRICE